MFKNLASVIDSWCPNNPRYDLYKRVPPSTDDDDACGEWNTKMQWFEEVIERYGFNLRVIVTKDIPPRHSMFDYVRELGVTKFDEIFTKDVMQFPDDWLIAFPERHCSLEEQRSLVHRIHMINDNSGRPLKHLDIITSQPYVVSDAMRECVSIIGFPEGQKTYSSGLSW